MKEITDTRSFMRVVHRYLGYFTAGIMAIYAISGILLIYRDTDFLKSEQKIEKTVDANLNEKTLGKAIKMKEVKVNKTENGVIYFNQDGEYNTKTGEVTYTSKELPFVLGKMTQLHKSVSKDKLSLLNVFFGLSLFFYVLSSFLMYPPKAPVFKKGMWFAAAGFVMALILLFI